MNVIIITFAADGNAWLPVVALYCHVYTYRNRYI